ncbi:MAG: sugar transferase, partial [Chlorobi bacterium]|nr:sugar transferase [Chlorobiota bacterium]
MLILGEKYKFIPLEIKKLKKYKLTYIKEQKTTDLIQAIDQQIKKEKYKLIILNTTKKPSSELIEYLTSLELQGIKFLTLEHFMEKYLGKIYIPKDIDKLSFLDEIKPYSSFHYVLKRAIDYVIAMPLGILTTPIMLYAAYRIKKESPNGPIIFKQKRIGLNGKEFVCYKFRSMIPDAEKEKPQFASKDDPRVFKWGAFMRKTRIDELPQLWNVIKGDMHMIGPRPERKYWIDIFEKNIP